LVVQARIETPRDRLGEQRARHGVWDVVHTLEQGGQEGRLHRVDRAVSVGGEITKLPEEAKVLDASKGGYV
jgi:hypothetical protein